MEIQKARHPCAWEQPLQEAFPDLFSALVEIRRDAARRIERLSRTSNPLSIGIIGQVKAGKSSFLNALLFSGATVLPKAATPKTAALTRIHYGEQLNFTAHYYDPSGWADLLARAQEESDDGMSRVAREIVANAKQWGTPVEECLQTQSVSLRIASAEDLQAQLNDFVGENGRYTPMVSTTELAWNNDRLLGVEIVDTPGMNDPVGSRVQKTREYLSQCDVVFFLSRSGQFLDASDLDLFTLQLPGKGIKRLYLVATQFDMGLLDDGDQRNSLQETISNVQARLRHHAKKNIESRIAQWESRPDLVQRLREAYANVIFMSSHAEIIAKRSPDALDEELAHLVQQFADLCVEWETEPLQPSDWERFSGFDAIREVFEQAKADKEAILAEQQDMLETELAAGFQSWVSDASHAIQERISVLQRDRVEDLEQRESSLKQQVTRIANGLQSQILSAQQKAKDRAQQLEQELRVAATEQAKLESRTGHDTVQRSVRVSTSKWWNPFSWGSYRTKYYTETISYQYIATADVMESILSYLRNAQQTLSNEIGRLLTAEELASGLRRALIDLVDVHAKEYDPAALRTLVQSTVSALEWPHWQFRLGNDPTAAIEKQFSGEVRDDGLMARLRKLHDAIIQEVNEQLATELGRQTKAFSVNLVSLGERLRDQLTESIERDVAALRDDLRDQKAAIQRYETLLQEIRGHPWEITKIIQESHA